MSAKMGSSLPTFILRYNSCSWFMLCAYAFVLVSLPYMALAGDEDHQQQCVVGQCASADVQNSRDSASPQQEDRLLVSLQQTMQALSLRMDWVEDKNTRLKNKVVQLEKEVLYLRAITKANTPLTCQDLQDLGMTVSGAYEIDPDGANVGEDPISVFCDFSGSSAITVVNHDIDGTVEVDHCQEPGCHVTPVTYSAPISQIRALMGMSRNCSQLIHYDCFATPLVDNGDINMAWWVGPDGKPNYYWDGNHTANEHICACGADQTCVNPNYVCNCDSSAPVWLSDAGNLTNLEALPVTELHFGGLFFDEQQAKFELGPLMCNGRMDFDVTESCYTLRLSGHAQSGYYIVDGPDGMNHDVVRCNMDLDYSDPEFQVSTSVKMPEFPVAFDFRRSSQFTETGSIIPFESYLLNHGEAMTMAGVFTAPLDGVYQFTFVYDYYDSYSNNKVSLRVDTSTVADVYGTGTAGSVMVPLSKGQEVDLYLAQGYIDDDSDMHFSGHLLYPL